MSYLKHESDLPNLKQSCKILMSVLDVAEKKLKAGHDCGEWNAFIGDFFAAYDAKPSFLGHYGYKYNVCISVNDEVVHGIAPYGKLIPDNSVVTFDCGAIYKGMFSDSAKTIIIGAVDPKIEKMLEVCKESLKAGIAVCKSGVKVRDIGVAIDKVVAAHGYGNVVDLGGHGVGYEVWSEPYISHKPISHPDQKKSLFTNKIICIEPMLTLGSEEVVEDEKDGWTIRTKDGSIAVHEEHEMIITKDGCVVLTDIPASELLPVPVDLQQKYSKILD
jgi:methionyl aminopeptidase